MAKTTTKKLTKAPAKSPAAPAEGSKPELGIKPPTKPIKAVKMELEAELGRLWMEESRLMQIRSNIKLRCDELVQQLKELNNGKR